MAPADNQRLRLFVATHEDFVRAVVARRIAVDDVDDVVQAVFIAAWRKFANLSGLPSPSAQRVWLYRAAHNELLARYRRNGRRTRLQTLLHRHHEVTGPATEPENDVLERSIAQLSASQRQVIKAVYWDGLGADELGLLLGCSQTAARKKLSRALDQLRTLYAMEDAG